MDAKPGAFGRVFGRVKRLVGVDGRPDHAKLSALIEDLSYRAAAGSRLLDDEGSLRWEQGVRDQLERNAPQLLSRWDAAEMAERLDLLRQFIRELRTKVERS